MRETIAARMDSLYGWPVDPEAVVATPGIIAAFNTAAWATCQPEYKHRDVPPLQPAQSHRTGLLPHRSSGHGRSLP